MHTNTTHANTLPEKAPVGTEKMLKAKNRLASDFSALVSDAEELLKTTAAYSGESVSAARSRFKDTLDQFKGQVHDYQGAAVGKLKEADVYVHENPWKIVGVAAAVGLLVGVLLHRK